MPSTWFDKQFLRFYRHLALADGLSSSTFAGACNAVAAVIDAATAAAVAAASPAYLEGRDAVPTIDQR
jgi:hypothetical protein